MDSSPPRGALGRSPSAGALVCRGLGVGTAIGALTGALTPAFVLFLGGGWREAARGSCIAVISTPIGAVVGFVCAVVPMVVMGLNQDYFLRHQLIARLCAVSGCLVLLFAAVRYAAARSHGSSFWEAAVAVPLAFGAALGVYAMGYVLNGRGASRRRCRELGRRPADRALR